MIYIQIVCCFDAEFFLYFEKCFDGWNHIEDSYIGSCLCQTFSEGKTTASCSSRDESRSVFE
ncbi:MAG: hypothetical protein CMJ90_16765 [Planctomycetes bacterium]|nr:hypothetical protein [Planctomycetota bacterium]